MSTLVACAMCPPQHWTVGLAGIALAVMTHHARELLVAALIAALLIVAIALVGEVVLLL